MAKEKDKLVNEKVSKQQKKNTLKNNSITREITNTPVENTNETSEEPVASSTKKKKKAVSAKSKKEDKVAEKNSVKSIQKIFSKNKTTRFIFQLNFNTKPGDNLYITANHEAFGNNDATNALRLNYLNEETWVATVDIDQASVPADGFTYNYFLKYADGSSIYDWGSDKKIDISLFKYEEVLIVDSWNYAGYFQNAFYTEPFKNVLLKRNFTEIKTKQPKNFTHLFKIKAPLLKAGETVCILGASQELGAWNEDAAVLLSRQADEDFFSVALDLSQADLLLVYKYGVFNINEQRFVQFEDGANRILYHAHATAKDKITITNDGFIKLADNAWKGAGVAVPVFSLRSKNSWGVGEFGDINLLVNWAKKTGLQLIQILPVNDTSATNTWVDSYPYAAISAFALHPMYLNLEALANDDEIINDEVIKQKEELNHKAEVDYEAVNNLKWSVIKQLYISQKKETFSSKEYKAFFHNNRHWLVPYAVFCFFKEEYKTSDFNNWPSHNQYNKDEVVDLLKDASKADKIAIHFFVQYHLHVQLQQAAKYAHENGIIMKGDIPIGVYRYGADAWQHPELYHMDLQAGAPPDDFAVKGQNWGFPTYNWGKMAEDGFSWWRKRFEQMSNYFDAFRIDHILGFFRIWSIPMNAVEGIMGHFEPCIPVYINEFHERNIWFDYHRYTKPFINDQVLYEVAGSEADFFKQNYLETDGFGNYNLKDEFSTQRKVEDYFISVDAKDDWKKQVLFDLISNVILFEAEGSNGQQYHFRFLIESTKSFQYLDGNTQNQLRDLYINYFFRRQDDFWKKEALNKLPALKRSTNMLVCGEDLGLVPGSVPVVMSELGLLSLEIQRMPKQTNREFFHPNNAPYLSVVTPSTHDMSTIRGWWEEDTSRTQRFYNYIMGQWGGAPFYCEPWINKAILNMHYYSPAMWSIFMLQDLLGISKELRRENPNEERINVPAISNYYWRYRMHLFLENLLNADDFNNELHEDIVASGRV